MYPSGGISSGKVPNRKIRITIITRDLAMGGAERFIIRLANDIDLDRFEVTLIILVKQANTETARLRTEVRKNVVFNPYHKNDPRSITWLGSRMKKADVNISFVLRADQTAALAAKLNHLNTLVVTERGGRITRIDTGIKLWLKKLADRVLTFSACTAAISNSLTGRQSLIREGMDAGKTHYIPNGIDIPAEYPKATGKLRRKGRITFGYIGRLIPTKGVSDILQAFAQVRSELPQAMLIVAGYGSEQERLKLQASRLGIEDAVEFPGYAESGPEFFERLDVGIIASYTESFPNVLLEYWRHGVPVIATDIPALQEITDDGKTALIFRPGDIEQLTARMLLLAGDEEKRKNLTACGFEEVRQRFDIVQVVKTYERFFEDFVSGRHAK